jgi:hypothetical protein
MLSVQQRAITITPVVTRSLAEMQAITDRAFFEGSSARWWYWTEEQCLGLTSKERMVYFFFAMGPADRTPPPFQRTIEECAAYLGMTKADAEATVNSLAERWLLTHYRCSAWYDFKFFEKQRRKQLRDRHQYTR